jgi:hypothetical protein
MRYPNKRTNALPKNQNIVFGENRRSIQIPDGKHPNEDIAYFLFPVDSLLFLKFVQSNDLFL